MLPSQRSVLFAVHLEGSTLVALPVFFRLLGQSKEKPAYRIGTSATTGFSRIAKFVRQKPHLPGCGIDRVESQNDCTASIL